MDGISTAAKNSLRLFVFTVFTEKKNITRAILELCMHLFHLVLALLILTMVSAQKGGKKGVDAKDLVTGGLLQCTGE